MGRRRDGLARLADALRAKRLDRELEAREGWSRERLLALRAQRVDAIVRHAAARSPHYRERLTLPAGRPATLADVEPIDRATFAERFDRIVCDPRLRREPLLAHVERVTHDDLVLGRYRVMSTSGSSGRKALFAYDRPDWIELLGAIMRQSRWAGTAPRLPRRRMAYVGPPGAMHMSRRMLAAAAFIHRVEVVPATAPVAEIAARLQAARPEILAGFPSVVALLAQEQLAGRLSIAPRAVSTSSELRTAEMTAVMREAWGVEPHDVYGITEAGILGVDCERHRGIHVFEDQLAVEVVDGDGRPVPDGEVGERMLVTSLVNRVQPTLRLEVADRVALDPEPCPCGRPMRLLRAVEGRADDVLRLPGAGGVPVPVHPLQFAPVAQAREVREFQVVQRGGGVVVRVVLHDGADAAALAARLEGVLTERLRGAGVAEPSVRVERCEALERDPARMGKLKLIVAAPG